MPKSYLSYFVGILADIKWPKFILSLAIELFVKIFNVDISESKAKIPEFNTFNEFFTRRLKESARSINQSKNVIVSPVDGKILSKGTIFKGTLVQAKGMRYTIHDLLKDDKLAYDFLDGQYIVFYLAPKNYHRIHSPADIGVKELAYIPGQLFPVNSFGFENIENLFPVNERLTTIAHSKTFGKMAIVKIGATVVGRIKASYDNLLGFNEFSKSFRKKYEKSVSIKKGQELGMFEMGSAVILLFEKDKLVFSENTKIGKEIKLGEKIGTAFS